jgi:dihydrofolate reductase
VVGGESVFRLLLPFCDSAHITRSYVNLASDRFFPDLDAMDNWYVTYEGPMERSGGVSYRFIDYVNRNPLPL